MTDMVPYFQNTGAAADGLHSRLSGVFWWAWNSNAGKSAALDRIACHNYVCMQSPCVLHTCSWERLGCLCARAHIKAGQGQTLSVTDS